MTGLLDGLLAFFVAAALNLAVVYNIRSRTLPADGGFLIRVYLWTVLLRYGLAVLLNVFVVDSTFAAAFWGDSGSYDIGGYQLSLNWSGESITNRLHVDIGQRVRLGLLRRSRLLRLRPQSAAGAAAERPDGGHHGPGDLCDRREALRPLLGALGGSLHGVLPADGLLVDRDVQGSRDPPLHRRGDVCRRRASREAVACP